MKRSVTLIAGVVLTLAGLVGSAAAGSGSPLSGMARTATGSSVVSMVAPGRM